MKTPILHDTPHTINQPKNKIESQKHTSQKKKGHVKYNIINNAYQG